MDKIKITILLGLHKSGREKSFSQILKAANVKFTQLEELEAASKLEGMGLIQLASYQLPLEIHAELTAEGKKFIETIESQSIKRNFYGTGGRA